MSATKIVFPAPPPTTNKLTAHERSQLVRKTKKIEQLLGATPHLVDISGGPTGPIHISFANASPQWRLSKARRSSIDSTTSDSSSGSMGSPLRRTSSAMSSPLRRSISSSSSTSISPISSRKYSQSVRCSSPAVSISRSTETWPRNSKAPILRLAMESRTLDPIPASPPATRLSFGGSLSDASISPSSSSDEYSPSTDSSPRLRNSIAIDSPRNSLVLDSQFIIPTQNSIRKQKMDRLRKKLGAGVPLELVFPNNADTDDEASEKSPKPKPAARTINRDKECPPLPIPAPRPKKAPRIAHTRDSIVDAASIHRAKRQAASGKIVVTVQPKKSRTLPPLPSPVDSSRAKQRLSLIVESPDEHGAGCTEELGIRLSRLDIMTRDSESSDRTTEWVNAEMKLWSTWMEYEGWNLAPAVAGPEPKSERNERKKRPTSYRKPVPSTPIDDCS